MAVDSFHFQLYKRLATIRPLFVAVFFWRHAEGHLTIARGCTRDAHQRPFRIMGKLNTHTMMKVYAGKEGVFICVTLHIF